MALSIEDKSKAKNPSHWISCQEEELWEDRDAGLCSLRHSRDSRTNFAYFMHPSYFMHAKLKESSTGKKDLIRVKNKRFTQAEFLMPSKV